MGVKGQHRFGKSSGWFKGGSVFWIRVLGWGIYRVAGESPYLLRPGRPPDRDVRHRA